MKQIPDTHRDILEKSQVVILSTIGPKGEPQTTALWFYFEDDILRMSINGSRQKSNNLALNPKASAFFIDLENPYRTIELRGTVTIEADPDYDFADKIGAKYNVNLREMDGPGEIRNVVTLDVDKVHTFG